jgi:hypothetical protein
MHLFVRGRGLGCILCIIVVTFISMQRRVVMVKLRGQFLGTETLLGHQSFQMGVF